MIQIHYIQIRYIQFHVKIGWFCVNRTRGRNSSTSICPVDQVSCPDMEIQVFPECKSPWTGFHVLTRRSNFCQSWESLWTGFHVLTRRSEICQTSDSLWTGVHILMRRSKFFQTSDSLWTGFHVLTQRWNPVHGYLHFGKTWIFVSGHEIRSTRVLPEFGLPVDQVSCPDTEIQAFLP